LKKLYLLLLLLSFSTLPTYADYLVGGENYNLSRFNYLYGELETPLYTCYFLGIVITIFLSRFKNENDLVKVSIIGSLFRDFSFNKLLTRKLLSILYFLVVWISISHILFSAYIATGEPSVGIVCILIFLLLWVIARVILEVASTAIKIAENTSELVRQNSQKEKEFK